MNDEDFTKGISFAVRGQQKDLDQFRANLLESLYIDKMGFDLFVKTAKHHNVKIIMEKKKDG